MSDTEQQSTTTMATELLRDELEQIIFNTADPNHPQDYDRDSLNKYIELLASVIQDKMNTTLYIPIDKADAPYYYHH